MSKKHTSSLGSHVRQGVGDQSYLDGHRYNKKKTKMPVTKKKHTEHLGEGFRLDEISKDTLISYIGKAAKDVDTRAFWDGHSSAHGKAEKNFHKTALRRIGMHLAAKKLGGTQWFSQNDKGGKNSSRVPATAPKPETLLEPNTKRKRLDEVSRELLYRYADKALKDNSKRVRPEDKKKRESRANMRHLALDKAANLTKVGAGSKKVYEEKKVAKQKRAQDEIEIEPEKHLINNR